MGETWLILADDLTGAADAAIGFARRGQHTELTWGEPFAADLGDASVLGYDCDSRRLGADDAAAAQRAAAARCLQRGPFSMLYKKIDSTLRGQPAAEIAALCGNLPAPFERAFGIFAPANPAVGRTTLDGRVVVNGEPLESTETWRREHTYPDADLVAIIESAALRAIKLPLAQVRAGGKALYAALAAAGAAVADTHGTILICDAETDEDLERIADAARAHGGPKFFIGTAGFANALARGLAPAERQTVAIAPSRHGALVVVGSLASIARAAARELAAASGVRHVLFTAEILLGADARTRTSMALDIRAALDRGIDVLVEMPLDEEPDLSIGPALVRALAICLAPALSRMSGLVATGGETAAALLRQCYVGQVRLLDELEAGMSLGLMARDNGVPIITKPGAFGDPHSLIRALDRLRSIRQTGKVA
ncbi:MAG: four-carbon acid sugar kinase family protein [Pseudomonadota bacterium]